MELGKVRPLFLNGENCVISNYNSTYQLNFPSSYSPKNEEIALLNLFIYYSWFNLTSTFNNLTCSYKFNTNTRTVTFPPGYYAVSDINNFIQLQMFNNGDYLLDNNGNPVYYLSLQENSVYYAVTLTATPIPTSLPTGYTNPHSITLSGNTPQLVFNSSNFNLLLGFNASTSYPPTQQTSTYQINSVITPEINPVYVVNINTNLSNNDGLLNRNVSTIYQFNPASTTFGEQIQINPTILIFNDIDNNTTFNFLSVSFTDQNNNALQINDTALSMTFVTRKKKT
jgi:hypothetical protein